MKAGISCTSFILCKLSRSFRKTEITNIENREIKLFCCGGCLVTKSCLTLCDPMDCSLPGSSVHGISQARILECAISFLTQGLNSHLLCFLYSQVDSSLLSHQRTQLITCLSSLNFFHWKNSVNIGYSKINITNCVLLCSILKLQTQETSEID